MSYRPSAPKPNAVPTRVPPRRPTPSPLPPQRTGSPAGPPPRPGAPPLPPIGGRSPSEGRKRSGPLLLAAAGLIGGGMFVLQWSRSGDASSGRPASSSVLENSIGAQVPASSSANTTPVTAPAPVVSAQPSAAPTTEMVEGGVEVVGLLAFVAVENEVGVGYDRELFSYGLDLDGDGCDTRAEVLQTESLKLPQIDYPGCQVREGDWWSLYDSLSVTDAADLEIDHVVALKEAWDSGAWKWQPLHRVAFANDLEDSRTLRAVSTAMNVAKGDRDPSNWLPPSPAALCPFLADWVAVKVRWGLSMDASEHGRISNLLGGSCAGLRTAPVTPAPVVLAAMNLPSETVPQRPFIALPPSGDDESQITSPAVYDPYYGSCADARAAGAAPLYAGEPGYRPRLDRDGDGVACE